MNYGYIKVYRQIQESFLWTDKPFSKGQAWIDLLLLANYQNSSILIRGLQINIKRGQLAYSQVSLGKRWGWGKTKIENFLKLLVSNKQINVQNNNVTTLITILNYDIYQSDQLPDQIADNSSTNYQTVAVPDSGHDRLQLQVIKDKKEKKEEVLIQEKTPEDIQLEEANERLKAKRKAIEESRNPKTLEYSQEERTFTYQNNKFNLTTILANKFVDAMFKTRLTEYLTWYCQTFNKLPNQFELDVSLMQLAQNYTCYDAMLILQRNMKPDRKKIDIRDYESVTHRNRIEDEEND